MAVLTSRFVSQVLMFGANRSHNVLLAVINAESSTKQLGVPKVDVKDPKLVKLVVDDIQHALVMGAFLFAACCPFPFSFTFVYGWVECTRKH